MKLKQPGHYRTLDRGPRVCRAYAAKANQPSDPHIIMNGASDPSTCVADICCTQTAETMVPL